MPSKLPQITFLTGALQSFLGNMDPALFTMKCW